jgi:hypothetical protein
MHRKLPYLLLIVIVPTILWGIIFYLIYRYWHEELPLLGNIQETNVILPFWLIVLFLAIGYIFSLLIGYSMVYKSKTEKDYKFYY